MANTYDENGLQAIVWLDMEDDLVPVSECDSTKIQVNTKELVHKPPWFTKVNVQFLNKQLTNAYACTREGNHILHQDIVTMEMLRYDYNHNVIYAQTAEEAKRQVRKIGDSHGSRVLAFLHINQFAHPARVAKLYDKLTHEVDILYPTRDEIIWDQAKIYDLQLLDEIATKTGAWRPKKPAIRSHSCGGGHVKFVDRIEHKGSPCRDFEKMLEKTSTTMLDRTYGIDYAQWIHQEYLPSLIDCEIRVFIATQPKKTANKEESTREPYVVLMVNSSFFDPENNSVEDRSKKPDTRKTRENNPRAKKSMHSTTRQARSAKTNAISCIQKQLQSHELEEREDEDEYSRDEDVLAFKAVEITQGFQWDEHQHLRSHHVETYALYMYQTLLKSNNKGFDSLQVGVRLDIGVAPDGTGLFVNEITRWYQADHFSFNIGTGDRVARAWAKSFAEVYPAAGKVIGVQKNKDMRERSVQNISGARGLQHPEYESSTNKIPTPAPQRYSYLGRIKHISGTKRKAEVRQDTNQEYHFDSAPKKKQIEVYHGSICHP